jgi:hypothetical protein
MAGAAAFRHGRVSEARGGNRPAGRPLGNRVNVTRRHRLPGILLWAQAVVAAVAVGTIILVALALAASLGGVGPRRCGREDVGRWGLVPERA